MGGERQWTCEAVLCILVIVSHSLCLSHLYFCFPQCLNSLQRSYEQMAKLVLGKAGNWPLAFCRSFWACCGDAKPLWMSLGFPRSTWIREHLWPWTDVGSPLLSPRAWSRTSHFLEWVWNLLQLIHMHCLNSELKEVLKIIYLLHWVGEAPGQEHVSDWLRVSQLAGSTGPRAPPFCSVCC